MLEKMPHTHRLPDGVSTDDQFGRMRETNGDSTHPRHFFLNTSVVTDHVPNGSGRCLYSPPHFT